MKYFCVISHTHWDREWYMSLERFRLRLVDLIDRCLITLEKYPEFVFHLDAQTIVLEDYLSIRPSKYNKLKKYISQGRLVVGPWYLQNDFYLTSGEATIRNLITGCEIADRFGKCTKVGYAPDQFGNISQLPQILHNFGIDNFVFGRGLADYKEEENKIVERVKTPTEFIWKGADGTKVLAVHMSFWYNNAQRFSENMENSKLLIELTENQFKDVSLTPYLLLMNGVDHLEAQDNLLPILKELNEVLDNEKCIQQYTIEDYIYQVKKYIHDHNIELKIYENELRNGSDIELLKGTLSSRVYLKTLNVKAQNMLECKLEPLYSLLEMSGAKGAYSLDHFRYMWKELMKNHPHDSICGCSCDEVHAHMEDNFSRLNDMSEEMLRRGLQIVSEHMDFPQKTLDDYIIIFVNTTEMVRNDVVPVTVDILTADGFENFKLFDNRDNEVKFDIVSKTHLLKDVFSPVNLPGSVEIDRFEILLYTENINPFSVKALLVRKSSTPIKFMPIQTKTNKIELENEYLKINVSQNGEVQIFDKKSGNTFENVLDIEETADRGDSYIHFSTEDKPICGSEFKAKVQQLQNNNYIQSIKISRKMILPAFYDFKNRKRSEETTVCTVDLILILKKGARSLQIDFCVNNTAKDHRIRLLVHTNVVTKISTADIPFDIISHNDEDLAVNTTSKVFPNISFAFLSDFEKGMAVFTEGVHEYEHIAEKCSLAFTLVRSTGVISRNYLTLESVSGSQWDCPENQCIRSITGRLAIAPFKDNYITAKIPLYAKQFRNELLTFCTSVDTKKFAGGRTAVQDTRISEFFYLPDTYKNVQIADNSPFILVEGEGVVVSALKKSEDEGFTVLRLVSLLNETVDAKITIKGKIFLSDMNEACESFLGENSIQYMLDPKKIITFKIN